MPAHHSAVAASFAVHKTKKCFSSIALDRAHEEVNAEVKGEGALGLTENPIAPRRWMLAGPKFDVMVEEFEGNTPSAEDHHHHEQKHGFQSAFL